MPEETSIDLAEYIGRPVAEVRDDLTERGVRVDLQPDAISGPLALLVAPASARTARPHGRVTAFTAADRITRFVVDEAGSLRGALEQQSSQLAEMQRRIDALEQEVARLAQRPSGKAD